MPAFVHSALLVGLWIVAVPVVIHLINMLRHRRVDWAAMEFLVASQKKNRTWITFKQLLLLLLRMLAIATIVLIVAQPLLRSQLGDWLGSSVTHHIVLLDDSFSMSDRWADTSAFADAKAAVAQIGTAVARERHPQRFTLSRFSQVGRGRPPDLLKVPVNRSEFIGRLEQVLREMEVSQSSANAAAALEQMGQLLSESPDQRPVVYLISDFRAREWNDPTELRERLLELNERQAEIHLVHCVERARPNLAISSLAPAEGVRAAGVPWFMEVTVRNFGTATAKAVSVLLEEDGHVRSGLTIPEIPPGRAVKERFPVLFPTAGQHLVTARLPGDAVAADNVRYATVELPVDVPVLLIDGSPEGRDARYVSMASAPGGPVRTGIRPQIELPTYLGRKPLERFHAICMMNVERLDESAIRALQQYVAAGGGVAFFLGEASDAGRINDRLYRDGDGLFPLPLAGPMDLLVDRVQMGPDLQVEAHPIFRVLAGKRNSFLSTVLVRRYFAPPDGWRPETGSTTRVIARLRNGAPFAVERRFGEGRVIAVLSTAAPVWNNWAQNPSFVVAMQDLQAYLSRRSTAEVSQRVGTKLELKLDPKDYRPQVRFVLPGADALPMAATHAVPTAGGSLAVGLSETDTSGVYEARLTRTDAAPEVRRFAFNVEAAEGDLKTLSGPELAKRLDGVKCEYDQASSLRYSVSELAGYDVSDWLLYLLIALLVGEQVLAFLASYHPPARHRVPTTPPRHTAHLSDVRGGVP